MVIYFVIGILSVGFFYFNYFFALPKYFFKRQYWRYATSVIVFVAMSLFLTKLIVQLGFPEANITLPEKPELYIENSPLFYADRVHTPCLIRQNDHDGAVPFSQGVEFFVALRRLGRPAWLLNYNNDEHNLTTKLSNRKDLSVRMKQFFDHYLKGAPAPDWMIHGVKAVDKKQNETYYLQFVK